MAIPAQPTVPRRDPRDQFALLPGPLQAFLRSQSCFEDLVALYRKHGLTETEMNAVVDLIGDIDFRYRPFSDLLSALTDEIKMPLARAKAFALDVAGRHFLPIADLIESDVWNTIKTWGGNPATFPAKKIETTKTTARALVDEAIGKLRAGLSPRTQERLRYVLLSRIQGVRNDVEAKEMLTRDEKVGGTALPPSIADDLLDELRRKLATAQIVTEMPLEQQTEEHKNVRTEELNQPATLPPKPSSKPVAPPVPPKPRPSLSEALPAALKFAGPDFEIPGMPRPKDNEEIATIRAELAERIPTNDSVARTRAASVASIVRASNLTFSDPLLSERFKRVVEARLRDIRDTLETKNLLMKTIAAGGLGITSLEAELATNLIEAEYQALTGLATATKRRESSQFEASAKLTTQARDAARATLEAANREDRFYKIAEKSKKLQEAEVLLPTSIAPSTEHLVPSVVVPKAPVREVVLSPASVSPSQSGKPLVEDVKVVRKIAGPIDELATMTIVEFRRLSKDPREAALKIRDKVELLKEEGFERYLAAVRAWQSSEPNRMYLGLTREALGKNTSVPTLIQEKLQTTQTTLTLDEFHAILSLNGQLQM